MLQERDGRALSRGLDRGSLLLAPLLFLAGALLEIDGNHGAAAVLLSAAALLVVGSLIRWRLGQLKRAGPEPAAEGSLWQPLMYRWYHAPHLIAQAVIAALIGLAGLVYGFSGNAHWPSLLAGLLWALLFLGLAYFTWRLASPKTRERDRARAVKAIGGRHSTTPK